MKVWDAQTGQELLSLKGGGGSVAFSPDGKRLASGRGTGTRWGGESLGCADRPGTPLPQGHSGRPAWPSARTASAWPPAVAPGMTPRRAYVGGGEGVGCADRPGTPRHQGAHRRWSRAWPSARTANAWPARDCGQDGEGVGCADRPGTPLPSRAPAGSVAFSPDGKRLASVG